MTKTHTTRTLIHRLAYHQFYDKWPRIGRNLSHLMRKYFLIRKKRLFNIFQKGDRNEQKPILEKSRYSLYPPCEVHKEKWRINKQQCKMCIQCNKKYVIFSIYGHAIVYCESCLSLYIWFDLENWMGAVETMHESRSMESTIGEWMSASMFVCGRLQAKTSWNISKPNSSIKIASITIAIE